jgi:hypothetical protein
MKRFSLLICSVLILGAAPALISQQRAANRLRNGVNIQQLTDTLYITGIQNRVELSDDQYAKLIPFLTAYLKERREIAQKHSRSLNQLRQATQRGASDDEIKPLIQDLDKSDADKQASIEKFQAGVDPLLSAEQQAKLRIFREEIENRLTNIALQARGWAPPPKAPTPATTAPAKPAPRKEFRHR